MVALKPDVVVEKGERLYGKQERRGGIETPHCMPGWEKDLPGSRNAVVALKQRFPFGVLPVMSEEAGTPWWH